MSFGRTFHRASTDMSMSGTVVDLSPIIATRLTDASGSTMIGGLPTLGSACAWVSRSWTIWRAA